MEVSPDTIHLNWTRARPFGVRWPRKDIQSGMISKGKKAPPTIRSGNVTMYVSCVPARWLEPKVCSHRSSAENTPAENRGDRHGFCQWLGNVCSVRIGRVTNDLREDIRAPGEGVLIFF